MADPIRTVKPPVGSEPSDDRSPVAVIESVTLTQLTKARTERRVLLAQVQANARLIAKLEGCLAGLGVEEVGE